MSILWIIKTTAENKAIHIHWLNKCFRSAEFACVLMLISNNVLFPVSYSMTRVPCAGRVLVDKTQPQTHRGYQGWTSLPRPPPLLPRIHLAMNMLPATPRFSPFHNRKHHALLRPSSSYVQLRQGQFSVSVEWDREMRWTLSHRKGNFSNIFFVPPSMLKRYWDQLPLLLLQSVWGGETQKRWGIWWR